MNKRKLILVIGMHRSGTSATAGVLEILGGKIGQKMAPTKHNAKGHFENYNFYRLNDKILKSIGCRWDNVSALTKDKLLNVSSDLKRELSSLLLFNLNNNSPFLLKDPRICVMYPLYEEILDDLDVDVYTIQVKRNSEEIIKSLMNRDKYTRDKCKNIINNYYSHIEQYISKFVLLTFTFEELLNNTDDVVKNIVKVIPILKSEKTANKINSFLDSKLKHHNISKIK